MSRVRDVAKALFKNPHHVRINTDRAVKVSSLLQDLDLNIPTWDSVPFYPQSDDFEEMGLFYLIFNSINYCYFDQDRERFSDGNYSGSTLATLRITEHWEKLKDPLFLKDVDENFLLTELFPANSPISLVKERTQALREVGSFLNRNTDFTFKKLFLKFHGNAYFVSQMLPELLPTWRDPFFKRAQLFVSMLYGRFQARDDSPITKETINDLTLFADYRIPQTLIAMGIIELDSSLLERLNRNQFIKSGSQRELEIRAATILGGDAILESVSNSESLNILHVDNFLWSARHHKDKISEEFFSEKFPEHHLTITTDY